MASHDDFYTPEQVDEQFEVILRTGQASPRDLRLIDDLLTEFSTQSAPVAFIDEDNERVLARVLSRLLREEEKPLSRKQSKPFSDHSRRRTQGKGEHTMKKDSASHQGRDYGDTSRLQRPLWRRLNTLAAVLVLLFLIGALLVVLKLARQNQQGSHSVAPSSQQQVSKSPGIYINNASHIFRLDATTHRVVWQQAVKDTAQIVSAGNVVYVLQERDSVLGLDANSGKILWTHPFPMPKPGQTASNLHRDFGATNMALYQGRLYIGWETWTTPNQIDPNQKNAVQVTSDEGWIFVLNASNGSQYAAYPKTSLSLLAVDDGVMVLSERNVLQVYNATSGKLLWFMTLPGTSSEEVLALSVVNHLLYATITSANETASKGQSSIVAYNIDTRQQVWQSPTFFSDELNHFTVDQNIIYFGVLNDSATTSSFAGKVYAYDVQSNKQLWSKPVDGGAQEPLIISNGVVYTVADQGSHARAHLVALDATTGTVKWQHTLNGSFLGDFCISNGVIYINSTSYAPNDAVSAQIDALDTSSGTTLWEYSQPGTGNIVPTE
jgi:outer membrane protein assembly factor BamB